VRGYQDSRRATDDPNTGQVISGPYHYGHRYGYEHRRLVREAQSKGMTQEEFNDWINSHPEWFQIEAPANNMSNSSKSQEWTKCR
jgi:HNH/ENDO VII superfamily nuclease with conserved GHE residues